MRRGIGSYSLYNSSFPPYKSIHFRYLQDPIPVTHRKRFILHQSSQRDKKKWLKGINSLILGSIRVLFKKIEPNKKVTKHRDFPPTKPPLLPVQTGPQRGELLSYNSKRGSESVPGPVSQSLGQWGPKCEGYQFDAIDILRDRHQLGGINRELGIKQDSWQESVHIIRLLDRTTLQLE